MPSSVNNREIILDALLKITRDGEYSHIVLNRILDKYQYLDKRERAFIARVTEGTLERMIELDYIIDQFSRVKVNKMKPVIRAVMRSAVYQMKYMDSIPDSAVCNEAVKLAVKRGFVNLKGFVNGVLREIGRNKDKITYPGDSDTVRRLSVFYSMPEWILEQWLGQYDEKTVAAVLEEFLKEKPLTVRFDPRRITADDLLKMLEKEGASASKVQGVPYALYLKGYDYLGKLESFQSGCFQVQDLSSMLVAEWAAPKEGDYIIDVCAAPGGKALHMAEKLCGTGHVEARDLTDNKVHLIDENIDRSGLHNIEAVRKDALVFYEDSVGKADICVADLPCSGLGVIGKKPDLKYKMSKTAQNGLAAMQKDILKTVRNYVKPGGRLIYSTCTINSAENEENARWFQETFQEFTLVREKQMLPGRDPGDGFYIAMFQRERHG